MRAVYYCLALACVAGATPAAAETKLPTACYEIYLPVCAMKDGKPKQYPNACFAKRDGATQIKNGPCSPR